MTKILFEESNTNLAGEIGKSVTGGFQTILAAITVPAILIASAFLIWAVIMLVKRFLAVSKTKPDEYKMEIKKLYWYIAGVVVLLLAIIFLITMASTNWSILDPKKIIPNN
ncbi:Uncharacterised protein [Mycoplasmopsis maculosa]|uniref:Uncharacterized protein n=1 Tax=Mycoplasmopsis maculosa TaxID=114885 RepID=A0A449B595_9BACT|nr:hypothetical protein [Mycoplasmopsis maculosa]VEU75770.1 Uncharacterised protein [Mycoplasmopsis maculosa]